MPSESTNIAQNPMPGMVAFGVTTWTPSTLARARVDRCPPRLTRVGLRLEPYLDRRHVRQSATIPVRRPARTRADQRRAGTKSGTPHGEVAERLNAAVSKTVGPH
jgi:hypothetical protein